MRSLVLAVVGGAFLISALLLPPPADARQTGAVTPTTGCWTAMARSLPPPAAGAVVAEPRHRRPRALHRGAHLTEHPSRSSALPRRASGG